MLGNWGDTFDDERMLEAIRNFNRTGRYHSEIRALVDEARDAFEESDGECREIIVVPPIDQASMMPPCRRGSMRH